MPSQAADTRSVCLEILDNLQEIRQLTNLGNQIFTDALAAQYKNQRMQPSREDGTHRKHHVLDDGQKQVAFINSGTFNLTIQVMVQAFQTEALLNKFLNPKLTTKEMKDLQKK